MNKFRNKEDFIKILKDGMSIMVGGFMCVGTPENLIDYIVVIFQQRFCRT